MSQLPALQAIKLSEPEREAFLERMRQAASPEDYQIIEQMAEVLALLQQEALSLYKLRHLLFGPSTEKTAQICPPEAAAPPSPPPRPGSQPRRKGHGRIRAEEYTGARWVQVPHPEIKPGDACPHCPPGRVRLQKNSSRLLRLAGAPPISATGYALERLRCDTCGEVFTAPAPPEAGTEKHDPSVGATLALLRYGCGLPHYRLARLQQSLGVPLPESTQWEAMQPLAEAARPVFEQMTLQAANASLIHQDDTTMRVLDLRRPGSASAAQADPKRKGTFTSSLLADGQAHSVALFFTGWQHAGENLDQVLRRRSAELEPPIQMCDALSRNLCPELETLLAHCLSHGRREFVTISGSFPAECRQVLHWLGEVCRTDAQAKEEQMNPEARLRHHQVHSQPVMDQLKTWMQDQIDGRKAEPNSALGKAIQYMLKHWEPLTLFLRQPGAPLDNNKCEQALKMAILHRKNSLSYKTFNGAQTGDLFMSLIHTCRLNGINPFEYLLAIAKNPEAVKLAPEAWLPWNYPQPAAQPDSG